MKNYNYLSADLFYEGKGMTGLNTSIREHVLGVLAYDNDVDPAIAGLVKFFKACFKKNLSFETEFSAGIAGEVSDRLYFFKYDVGDKENGTIQVFQCDSLGRFSYTEDRKIMSQERFLKCFKALTEDLKKAAR